MEENYQESNAFLDSKSFSEKLYFDRQKFSKSKEKCSKHEPKGSVLHRFSIRVTSDISKCLEQAKHLKIKFSLKQAKL